MFAAETLTVYVWQCSFVLKSKRVAVLFVACLRLGPLSPGRKDVPLNRI
jgi:hypothetical protein